MKLVVFLALVVALAILIYTGTPHLIVILP